MVTLTSQHVRSILKRALFSNDNIYQKKKGGVLNSKGQRLSLDKFMAGS